MSSRLLCPEAHPTTHENVYRQIPNLCMSNGVEGRRGVSPRATSGLERLNYAARRRVYLKALFSICSRGACDG
jgi:hypothetical protein